MSKYSEFADKFLFALYAETEHGGEDFVAAGDLLNKYDIDYKPHWISNIADEWEHRYFSQVAKVLDGYESWSFKISGMATRYLEQKFDDIDQQSLEAFEFAGSDGDVSFPIPSKQIEIIDWKEVENRLQSEGVAKVCQKVDELEQAIHQADLDDRTRVNALKRTNAIKSLLEAPDPAWKEIVLLLNNPVFGAMLNVIGLIQLILGSA